MKVFLYILICLSFSNFTLAQGNGVISGKVVDSKEKKSIEYATIKLLKVTDSSLVQGIFTNADGKFVLENVPNGKYMLKILMSGFETTFINDISINNSALVFNCGQIELKNQSIQEMDEVKVIGNTDDLKVGIDKKVYNVADDVNTRTGTVNDVLNNIPSVDIDQNGKVSLRGDANVTILIDGRPSSLTGGNGKSILDALPANSVERIEIVNNPSAKYDPDGTSGIINIVLKKSKLRGFNGLIMVSGGSGDLKSGNTFDGSASLSYRNQYLNAYASYSNRFVEGYRNNFGDIYRYFPNDSVTDLRQDRIGSDFDLTHTFRLGSDFYLKARHTLGVSWTGSFGDRNRKGVLENRFTDQNGQMLNRWDRSSYDPTNRQNMDFNLNYKHDLKKELGDIIFNATQSIGNENQNGFYEEIYYNPDGTLANKAYLNQRLFNKEKNNVTTLQLDFTRKLNKIKGRLEYGAKAILRDQGVTTFSDRRDTLSGTYIADTLANFEYTYKEQIYSLYTTFGQQFGKFKYQIGVRGENAYQIPNLLSSNLKIDNVYWNFFPSAHVKYNPKDKQEISLSYSRRINRAESSNLNPFTNYSDPFNLRKGNPYLQPEFINSFDLGYSIDLKKVSFLSSVFYRYTTDVIQRVKEFYPNNTSAVTYANIDESHSGGLELVVIYRPTKWWKNNISANGNYIQYYDNTPGFDRTNNGFNWTVKYVGTFEFWKKTATVQINARYNSIMNTAQGRIQRPYGVDVSGEKTLKGGAWTIGFKVTDVFNTQRFQMELIQPTVTQESEFKWMTRRVYLTVTYKFGKLEISNKQRAIGDAGGGEM